MSLLVPAACALVTSGPAFLAACRVTARRPFAPLVRGSLERCCVLAAAGLAAATVTVLLGCGAATLAWCDDDFTAIALRGFVLFAAPAIAAAAFTAGEVLSGPSPRQEPAFAAAVIASYAAGVLAFGTPVNAGAALGCSAAASALAASAAYLAIRGEA